MIYGSVCSGIEAATAAWHPLGWKPAFFSEIEKFPRAVLSHHYPEVPLHGDFTTIETGQYAAIDVLVGGTPCQSFSLAGLRKGLDDPRGNLMLGFGALAERLRPRWLVWENVPGVLSCNGGRDFGSFLGMLGELGYGFSYRVLDAQFFGVAQRRRRVFVVAYLGDWRRAAAVLFERHSLSGNPAPSREKRKSTSESFIPGVVGSLDTECGGGKLTVQSCSNGHLIPSFWDGSQVTQTLDAVLDKYQTMPEKNRFPAVLVPISFGAQMSNPQTDVDLCQALQAKNPMAVLAFDTTQVTSASNFSNPKPGDPCHPLAAGAHPPAIAIQDVRDVEKQQNGRGWNDDGTSYTVDTHATQGVASGMMVRRLTVRECERLQGFPDDYTMIPWRNKTADQCPDGPRYKALGNSMAVPVMNWIGKRIQTVESI